MTLRIPPVLHQKLQDGMGNLSLSASIVRRLDESFDDPDKLKSLEDVRKAVLEDVRQEIWDMVADMQREQAEEDQRS